MQYIILIIRGQQHQCKCYQSNTVNTPRNNNLRDMNKDVDIDILVAIFSLPIGSERIATRISISTLIPLLHEAMCP